MLRHGRWLLGSVDECIAGSGSLAGFIAEVQGSDEAAPDGEDVENLTIRQDIALKALH